MTPNEQTITICDGLLRGELSAIETYSQAIHKFPDTGSTQCLTGIRKDHLASAKALRELVAEAGGNPSTESGLWGDFAMSLEAGAALLGESPALAILKQGEKHGASEYETAIASSNLCDATKAVLRNDLLPRQHNHLLELDQIA